MRTTCKCGAVKTPFEDQCSWECGTYQSLIGGSHLKTPQFKLIESTHCKCRQSLRERDEQLAEANALIKDWQAIEDNLCKELTAATARADAAERERGRLTKGVRDLHHQAATHKFPGIDAEFVTQELAALLAQPEKEVGAIYKALPATDFLANLNLEGFEVEDEPNA